MRCQVLLVESDSPTSTAISQVLGEAGHDVTTLTSFEAATVSAAKSRPDLLIAGVRLGRFNGLHLAARFRSDYPGMPIIILGHEGDAVLAAEAIQLRARFVPKTTPPSRLMAFVDDLLAGRTPRDLVSTRRWQRWPTAIPVQMQHGRGWAVDIGYGGMRVECDTPAAIDQLTAVTLTTMGIDLTGTFRWAKKAETDTKCWCGFEVDPEATDARRWRRIVDSLPRQ